MKHYVTLILILSILPDSAFCQRWMSDFKMESSQAVRTFQHNDNLYTLVNQNAEQFFILRIDNNNGLILDTVYQADGLVRVIEPYNDGFLIGGVAGDLWRSGAFILHIDSSFNRVWRKQSSTNYPFAFHITEDDRIFLGGITAQPGSRQPAFIGEINGSGNIIWQKEISRSSQNIITKIQSIGDELIILNAAGTVGAGFEGVHILRLTRSGETVWQWSQDLGYGIEYLDGNYRPHDFIIDMDANIIIGGSGSAHGINASIIKLNELGSVLWEKRTSGGRDFQPTRIISNTDGRIFVGGDGNTSNRRYQIVQELDANGNLIWQTVLNTGTPLDLYLKLDTIYVAGCDTTLNRRPNGYPTIAKITTDGKKFNGGHEFHLLEDIDNNCQRTAPDLIPKPVTLQINDEFIQSDKDGLIQLDLEPGNYDLEWRYSDYYQACNLPTTLSISSKVTNSELFFQQKECRDLRVGLSTTTLTRCQSTPLFVQWENKSPKTITNAKIEIIYPEELTLEEVSMPYNESNNTITLSLTSLDAFETGRAQLDFLTPCEARLGRSLTFEAQISPKYTCNEKAQNWNGSHLTAKAECINNAVSLEITNEGNRDMLNQGQLEITEQTHPLTTISIFLDKGKSKTFNFPTSGNTLSYLLRQEDQHGDTHPLIRTIEGCGSYQNNDFARGAGLMYNSLGPNQWHALITEEVRDIPIENRITETPKGIGVYHVIDSTFNQIGLTCRVDNNLDELLKELTLTVSIPIGVDPNTLNVRCSSHDIQDIYLKDGLVRLQFTDLDIKPDDFLLINMEFSVTPKILKQSTFIDMTASAILNETTNINILPGFYNILDPFASDTISPFYDMEKVSSFGTPNCMDFNSSTVFSEKGEIYFATSSLQAYIGSIPIITAINPSGEIEWRREFPFKEGGAVVSDMVYSNGRMYATGYIDNKDIPDNYVTDNYNFILCIDQNGLEQWRKVWRPQSPVRGESFDGITTLPSGNLILAGIQYDENGSQNIIVELTTDGTIINEHKFLVNNQSARRLKLKKYKSDEIFLGMTRSSLSRSPNQDPDYVVVRLNDQGAPSQIMPFTIQETGDTTLRLNDFTVTENGDILIVGLGYVYQNLVDSSLTFGYLGQMDVNGNHLGSKTFFKNSQSKDFETIEYIDNALHIGSSWSPDTTYIPDLLYINMRTDGTITDLNSVDVGTRGYPEEIIFDEKHGMFMTFQTQTSDIYYDLQAGHWNISWNPVVSTHNYGETQPITIYPNPASNEFTLETDVEIAEVRICDLNGKCSQPASSGSSRFEIDYLPTGTYLVIVKSSEGKRFYSKLIKH